MIDQRNRIKGDDTVFKRSIVCSIEKGVTDINSNQFHPVTTLLYPHVIFIVNGVSWLWRAQSVAEKFLSIIF